MVCRDMQGTGGPSEFSFANLFPNPSSENTTIHFALPEPSSIRVYVVDILGKEVERILDTSLSQGYHMYPIESTNWSAGVYFVRLEARGETGAVFQETRKMTVIR